MTPSKRGESCELNGKPRSRAMEIHGPRDGNSGYAGRLAVTTHIGRRADGSLEQGVGLREGQGKCSIR
jgi:hypothetical protein